MLSSFVLSSFVPTESFSHIVLFPIVQAGLSPSVEKITCIFFMGIFSIIC